MDRKRQHTIRSIPPALDRALRQHARNHGKSLNQSALDALGRGLGVGEGQPLFHDLDFCIGTWEHESGFDEALAAQDQVDPDQWR